ncbi:PhoH family protein [Halothermothrix orenii]|uniref:PhoH family protein n=1 Tax=Halothermothrix orenii (strain H 168 / OCM 544 / DSM 9562) TaxID=373903 RepID=B8CX28_HALOH|nr:PhoH family protein [Halothermothrix orenii]ACL69847.1 PhoH family protein [Halothermothrix orenii H 168]
MASKIFVLDTNVLLMDPMAIYSFDEHEIVIPLPVVEEIDNLKNKNNSIGYNARETSRILNDLRSKGRLNEGVELPDGGLLRLVIDFNDMVLPKGLSFTKMDNRILSTAINIKKEEPGREVILVSNDINLRLIADAFGLKAEEHKSSRLKDEDIYTGIKEIDVPSKVIDLFFSNEGIPPEDINNENIELYPQEMVQFNAIDVENKHALGRYDGNRVVPFKFLRKQAWGIKPRNREQSMAFELLLNDDIKLVTLAGKAGTGKTLLALACGLAKVTDEGRYNRLLVARPVVPMGNDIGFLPGSKEEKLQPWMQPIFDNLEYILGQPDNSSDYSFEYLVDKDLIQVEALTYIRGRSIPGQFIIIDEAQNLSSHEIKTIITRVGKGSKIVLTGDPYQIDNPYLDLHNNGLTHLAHKFHQEKIGGHVTLVKGERSELAEIASKIL